MSGENWAHVAPGNVVFDYPDKDVIPYLPAWTTCCGREIRCNVGFKTACPDCGAEYSVGWQRAVLVKVPAPELAAVPL